MEELYMVVRSDHSGNYYLWYMKTDHGIQPAWDLTEEKAEALVASIYASHSKVHGQTYWAKPYPKGERDAFIRANKVRV